MSRQCDYDFVVIGSGFGGSVSALRLVEKGYRVLLLEKGSRKFPEDFAKTNWDLRRWIWLPALGWRGIFKMTFLPHLTVLSGVGVGGGSLVYGNTLPVPAQSFFDARSWASLADWKRELTAHYRTAQRMLGATANPLLGFTDEVIREVGRDIGREDTFEPTQVAVFFGEAGKTVPDPYFGGEGPDRTGCISCGGCMIGCRHGAKNTLDKNYLYLAERRGLTLEADTEVTWIQPLSGSGYTVEALYGRTPWFRQKRRYTANNIVLAGGVLGTVGLLLKLKQSEEGLPHLSDQLGNFVRTNSESIIAVVSKRRDRDLSKGVAISSILHTDDHSHMEPVRYSEGSGFWRTMTLPHVHGNTTALRLRSALQQVLRQPLALAQAATAGDWAKQTMILLYMRTLDGYLRLALGRGVRAGVGGGLTTELAEGPTPTASIAEADDLAERVAQKIDGVAQSLLTETVLGIPTTAHILGGCCMGASAADGVIDTQHRVFGYDGLYVVDGAAVSANPGVNPSLTIAALAERAMSFIREAPRGGGVSS
jgi:cholesterol oxidase